MKTRPSSALLHHNMQTRTRVRGFRVGPWMQRGISPLEDGAI